MSPVIKAQSGGATFGPRMRASGAVARGASGTLSTTLRRTFRGRRLHEGGLHDEEEDGPLGTVIGAQYGWKVTSTLHSGQEAVRRVREGLWGSRWAGSGQGGSPRAALAASRLDPGRAMASFLRPPIFGAHADDLNALRR